MEEFKKAGLIKFFVFFFALMVVSSVFAQTFPPQEGAGTVEEAIEKEKKKEEIIKQIETEKEKPVIEQEDILPGAEKAAEEKFFVKKVLVTGSTVLSQKEIADLTQPFEDREVSLKELRQLTDKITILYRQKGYITSMSFIPPQKLKDNVVEIRVLEGKAGEIEIRGNRYFKSPLIRKKITLKEGELFDYEIFQRCIQYINEHLDRTAKAIMMAGKKPGTTDIVVDVQDRLPIHLGLKYDNFGSRYTGYSRYDIQLSHNNITGNDDILTAEWQFSNGNRYYLTALRYIYPFYYGAEIGISFNKVEVDLGKDYEDLDTISKGKVYDLYYSHPLVRKEKFDLNANLGFERKDLKNYILGEITSKDRLRIFKFGMDADMIDSMGRTILTGELRFGVDRIMAGYENKSRLASRSGARSKFRKIYLYLARVHDMPWDTSLLLRFAAQLSPHILCASEQFLIGGVDTVRGFPRSERSGDEGMNASAEYSLPLYGLPKGLKVPFTKVSFYDALKIVFFYDWGRVRNRRVQAGENKNYYLTGAGAGLRFTLPNDFFARFDVASPVNIKPSNNSKTTIYIEAKKTFSF